LPPQATQDRQSVFAAHHQARMHQRRSARHQIRFIAWAVSAGDVDIEAVVGRVNPQQVAQALVRSSDAENLVGVRSSWR